MKGTQKLCTIFVITESKIISRQKFFFNGEESKEERNGGREGGKKEGKKKVKKEERREGREGGWRGRRLY